MVLLVTMNEANKLPMSPINVQPITVGKSRSSFGQRRLRNFSRNAGFMCMFLVGDILICRSRVQPKEDVLQQSIVAVSDRSTQDSVNLGSGFFINKKGWVVTDHHVVNHAQELTVVTHAGRSEERRVG